MTASLFDGTAQEAQWQLSHLQLINWGTFDGATTAHFENDFENPAVTVICGESGTGKSTLQDAYSEIMTRSPRYNEASNGRAGNDRGKRTLSTYLRGMLDYEYDERADEERERMLRDGSRARWSAIGAVFVDSLSNRFTAAKAFYLPPGCDGSDRESAFYLTANEELDLSLLDQVATSKFDKRSIARALPHASQHDGRGEFLECVGRSLGMGDVDTRALMTLLTRIRSGKDFTTVSALFRDLVLEQPDTYERADKAIEEFDAHMEAYQKLKKSSEQRKALAPIVEHKKAYDQALVEVEACERAGSLADQASPLRVWLKGRREEVVAEVLEGAVAEVRTAKERVEEAQKKADEANAQVQNLEARVEEAGGGKVKTLEAQIATAKDERERRKRAYERLAASIAGTGWEIPQDEKGFGLLAARAKTCLEQGAADVEKIEAEHDLLAVRMAEIEKRSNSVRADLAYCREHRGNIPRELSLARDKMASAAGLDPEELPFAGELMEVAQGQDQWRQAIEICLHGLSRTVLVDKGRLEHLRRSIDTIDPAELGVRVNFRGIDVSDKERRRGRAGGVAEKLELDPQSPFTPWLSRVLADENHDALCVEGPGELRGADLRITRSGQMSQGAKGAHGRGRRDANVIGFSNEAQVARLTQDLAKLGEEEARLRGEKAKNQARRSEAEALRAAAGRVLETTFPEIDVAGAQRELDNLSRALDEFLRGNARLADLKAQLAEAKKQHENCLMDKGSARKALERAEGALAVLRSEAAGLAGAAEKAAELDPACAEHIEALVNRLECPYATARDLHASFLTFERQVENANKDALARARAEAEAEKRSIEAVFAQFQMRWDDPNRGETIDSYDDYANILFEIESHGIDAEEAAWRSKMVAWIRADLLPLRKSFDSCELKLEDRIPVINGILAGLPFGADAGMLRLSYRARYGQEIREFKRKLQEFSAHASSSADFDPVAFHDGVAGLLAKIRLGSRERDVILDTRRYLRVTAKASWPEALGRADSYYDSLAGKSGGEVQELVAFISAAALLYCQGTKKGCKPVFAPVMLDEGFSKADSNFTARAIAAWKGFGFQLIVVASQDKFSSMAMSASACVYIEKDKRGASVLWHPTRKETGLGA